MSRQVMVLNGTYTPTFDASAHTANRAIVLPDLAGTMALQQGVYSSLGDFASGGSIGSAMGIDAVGVAQTTAGKVLTIDTPTDTKCRSLLVCNTGSAGLWMYGRYIRPGGSHEFVYVPSVGWRRTCSGEQVIAQSAVQVTAPADTSENTLVTLTIPGGVVGIGGAVIVDEQWNITNSANAKTMRIKFGSSLLAAVAATTSASYIRRTTITNRGSESAQVGATNTAGFGGSSQTLYGTAVDTSADFTVNITAQKASAGESMTLESYSICVRRFA